MEMAPIPSFNPPDLGKAPTTLYLAELSHGLLDGGGPLESTPPSCEIINETPGAFWIKTEGNLNWNRAYEQFFPGVSKWKLTAQDLSRMETFPRDPTNPDNFLLAGFSVPVSQYCNALLLPVVKAEPELVIIYPEPTEEDALIHPFGRVPEDSIEPDMRENIEEQQGILDQETEEKLARAALYGTLGILTIVFLLARRALTKDRRY
jgi:hypothetical protein